MNDGFFKVWFLFMAVFSVASAGAILYLFYLLIGKL